MVGLARDVDIPGRIDGQAHGTGKHGAGLACQGHGPGGGMAFDDPDATVLFFSDEEVPVGVEGEPARPVQAVVPPRFLAEGVQLDHCSPAGRRLVARSVEVSVRVEGQAEGLGDRRAEDLHGRGVSG
ncbi:hypothetical protein D3C87_1299670 [compost metagenome]